MSRKAPSKAGAAGGKTRKKRSTPTPSTRSRGTGKAARRTGKSGHKPKVEKSRDLAVVQEQEVPAPTSRTAPEPVEAPAAVTTPAPPDDSVLAGAPEKPVAPVLKQVVTNDVTTEKLAVIMSNNPRGVIRLTDELAAFIRTMNLYHGGHGADRQFYLSSWSGSTAQVDRKSQPTPVVVREPFVNVLGGIQPDMVGTLEDERGREDGFIHRFLFTFPAPAGRPTWDRKGVSQRISQVWATVVQWLFDLAMQEPEDAEYGSEPQPRTVRLTPEAEQVLVRWHKAHWDETEWDCFPPHLRGVWSKFEVHALTLVLVAHLLKVACDHALAGKDYRQDDPPIDAESMRRGLKLADYFKHHNVRVFNRLKVSNEDLRAQRVVAWVRKRPGKRAAARELQMNEVAGIRTASEAKAILKDLEDRGWGEMKPGKTGGKGGYFQAA